MMKLSNLLLLLLTISIFSYKKMEKQDSQKQISYTKGKTEKIIEKKDDSSRIDKIIKDSLSSKEVFTVNASFNNDQLNNFSFSGIWKAECTTNDHVSNILFYKKDEGDLSIYYKTKLIAKMMVEVSSDNKSLKYIGTNIIGEGVDIKKITTLTKGDVLAKIDIINEYKISVNWLDFIKEKIFIKNLFGKENSIILSKCSE